MADRYYDPFTGMPIDPVPAPEQPVYDRWPNEPSAADAYRMGDLAATDQYSPTTYAPFDAYDRAQQQTHRDEKQAQAVQRSADVARGLAGQAGPADVRPVLRGMRAADAIGEMFAPDDVLGATTLLNPVRVGRKAIPAAAGAILGSDPAEAGGVSKLGALADTGGRIAERQASGYSKIKGGTPASEMNWRLQRGDTPLETRTTMPVDKALRVGDTVIPIVGDDTRKLLEGYLIEFGGQRLPKPVLQEGGFDFALGQKIDPRTGLQDVWGNNPSAATNIDKLAREALERGSRPVVMSTTMAKTGGDFGNQTFDTIRQVLRPESFSDELKTAIDTNMRKNMFAKNDAFADWPGIASPNLDEYIAAKGGNLRAKLTKILDAKRVIAEGGPDVGMARIANANPDLYNTPSGYMGYHIADVTPGTGPAKHSTFPVATHGTNVRGLGGSVPGELVLRDLAAGLQQMYDITGKPQYLNRMDYFAIKPPRAAAEKLGLQPLPKTQVVDQQMIDSISEYVRKHGLKSVPPAMLAALYGQMGDTAATDSYDAR